MEGSEGNGENELRMKAALLLVVFLIFACGGPAPVSTSAVLPVASATSTTSPSDLEVTIQGCGTPPVTFSLLCEVVELIETNHFSPPDRPTMAAAALDAVATFESPDTEELPRGLVCAVPSEEFAPLCEGVRAEMLDSAAPVSDIVEGAVDGVLSAMVDPYNVYVPPELSGSLGEDGIVPGVGMVIAALSAAGSPCIRVAPSCPLQVVTVLPDSAAEAAGIRAGVVITAIDGEPVEGLGTVEAAGLLAGEAGTTAVLTIGSSEVTLTRTAADAIPMSGEIVGSTAYLRLPEFGFATHLELHVWLTAFNDAGVDRLIMDLRDNPGGFLFSASIVGSEFVPSGVLYRTQERAGNFDYPAVEGGIATRVPLILLVNENSASAAEILAASLQERDRAVVVGTPTFGKNLVQSSFELRNGGLLRLTIATWTTADGASVAGTGVVPDVVLSVDPTADVASVVSAVLSALG
ncbi:MAG TPA: S41 family peptidase [Acidimicrobiia bacterium]|jgi:carboxyl-terminal processing protease